MFANEQGGDIVTECRQKCMFNIEQRLWSKQYYSMETARECYQMAEQCDRQAADVKSARARGNPVRSRRSVAQAG